MSRGDIRYVYTIDDRSDLTSLYGRHSIREVVSTEEKNADPPFLEERCNMSEGRPIVFNVSRGGHEKESYHRGSRQSTNDQKKGRQLKY